jgi:hypothetical protein
MHRLLPLFALLALIACERGPQPGDAYVNDAGGRIEVLRAGTASDLYTEHHAMDGTTRTGRGLASSLTTQRTVLKADSSADAVSYSVETVPNSIQGAITEIRIVPLDSLAGYTLSDQ